VLTTLELFRSVRLSTSDWQPGQIALPKPPPERAYSGEIGDEWISRVEELILRSVYEDWSLEDVAQRANVSLRYLRDRFEKVIGLSPSEYRANYQLHAAMLLMRDSRLSLSQVAERSGFRSLPVFSRFVKRRVGMTPSTLRKSLLRGEFEFKPKAPLRSVAPGDD